MNFVFFLCFIWIGRQKPMEMLAHQQWPYCIGFESSLLHKVKNIMCMRMRCCVHENAMLCKNMRCCVHENAMLCKMYAMLCINMKMRCCVRICDVVYQYVMCARICVCLCLCTCACVCDVVCADYVLVSV